jgi:hypothetical protein
LSIPILNKKYRKLSRKRKMIPSRDSNSALTQSAFSRNGGSICRKFGLELHPDKTRLIEFGRHAAVDRKLRGEGKPEVFDFLGFTHICGTTRKTGRFIVKRKTIRKRLSAKFMELKEELRRRWHQPVAEVEVVEVGRTRLGTAHFGGGAGTTR